MEEALSSGRLNKEKAMNHADKTAINDWAIYKNSRQTNIEWITLIRWFLSIELNFLIIV